MGRKSVLVQTSELREDHSLPSALTPFLPSFLPSFHPSFLPSSGSQQLTGKPSVPEKHAGFEIRFQPTLGSPLDRKKLRRAWQRRGHFFLWKTLASMAPDVVSWPILLRNLVLASSPTKLEAMDMELRVIKRQTGRENTQGAKVRVRSESYQWGPSWKRSLLLMCVFFFFFLNSPTAVWVPLSRWLLGMRRIQLSGCDASNCFRTIRTNESAVNRCQAAPVYLSTVTLLLQF